MRATGYFVAAVLFLTACGGDQHPQSNVSSVSPDGVLAKRDQYPSVVALVKRSSPNATYPNRFCTASRITDPDNDDPNVYTFLTASHCIAGYSRGVLTPVFGPGDELGVFTHNKLWIDFRKHTHYGTIIAASSFQLADAHDEKESVAFGDISIVQIKFATISDELKKVQPAEVAFETAEKVRAGGYGVSGLQVTSDRQFAVTDENLSMNLYINEYDVHRKSNDRHIYTRAEADSESETVYAFGLIPISSTTHTLTKAITMGDSGGPVYKVASDDQTKFNKIIGINNLISSDGFQLHESLARLTDTETFFAFHNSFKIKSGAANRLLTCATAPDPFYEGELKDMEFTKADGSAFTYNYEGKVLRLPKMIKIQFPAREGKTAPLELTMSESGTPTYAGFDAGFYLSVSLYLTGPAENQTFRVNVTSEKNGRKSYFRPGTCEGAEAI